MDYSTRKKIGCIGVVIVMIAVVLGYGIYKSFFNEEPTCFDGKQNQNERCVDGGGVCSRVCPMDAKTIVPRWSRVFNVSQGVWSVVAYVENQNPTAGVQKINYEFRVYDENNILAGTPLTGSTFIGPNERTAIFESPIDTGNRIPTEVFFKFTSAPEWITTDKKYTVPQISSRNSSLVYNSVTKTTQLSADVVNETLFDYQDIEMVVILYDEAGNALTASKTYVENLPQQTSQKIYFTWPQTFDRAVTRIEIIPRLNPFIQP